LQPKSGATLLIATKISGWYHSPRFFFYRTQTRIFSALSSQDIVGVMSDNSHNITDLLITWSRGNGAALEELIPLVYPELRRLARRYLRQENPAHTLQTSALINEAYLRMVNQQVVKWQDRRHFFAVAAQVMRRILIDHARKHHRAKRGGGAHHVALDEGAVIGQQRAAEFLALDAALIQLAKIDERKSRIVELRFFGGLTVEEVAELMDLSPITIKREWRSARAWLQGEISARQTAN
jgi:RNA polymerase sigma factor (TIGR02999 family)